QEPPAGPRRATRVRDVRAAECEDAPDGGVRVAARADAQVADADLLQRPGGDLPGGDGRARCRPPLASEARAIHRPAVRRPQRSHRAALHRGHALLRDPRLARLSSRGAAALMSAPWRFEHELEVRFRDCDPMGHVNNAVYLTYLESARFAWWRSAFGPLGLKEHGFIVARVEIDYRKPALPGDRLLIRLRVDTVGRSSFAVGYEISHAKTSGPLSRAHAR